LLYYQSRISPEYLIAREQGSPDRDRLVGDRAGFNAHTAARAQVHIDGARPFPDLNFEISRGTLNRFHISIGNDLDV